MLLTTMEQADGWLKMVVSPAAMLKLCQFRNALCDVVMVSREPLALKLAEPLCTVMPVGLAGARQMKPSHKTAAITRQSKKSKCWIFINGHPINCSNLGYSREAACYKSVTIWNSCPIRIECRRRNKRAHQRRLSLPSPVMDRLPSPA